MGLEKRRDLGLGVLKYMGLRDMSQIYEKGKLSNVVKAFKKIHPVHKDNKNNIVEGKKLNLEK